MAVDLRQNGQIAIDSTNRRILAELQADARLSLAELGRRVGLSSPAVADRVQRLERDGVITGYHAEVDPRALGYELAVVIRVRPAPRQIPKVADLARAIPEIVECHRITGEDCFFVKAHVRSVEHLEDVIDQLNVYGQTTTSIVQSSAVPRRGVPVGDEGTDGGPRGGVPVDGSARVAS
jgi:Lrp/AsnC family transcriptional regulator, leucine-responsive regulatory protein